MKRNIFIGAVAAAVGFSALILSGCTHDHKALNGVYYGYYNDHNNNHFVILSFDQKNPGKVAMRLDDNGFQVNGVYAAKYTENTVTIHPNKTPIVLQIADNNYTLTCAKCNGSKMPKTYTIGTDKGKPFEAKVADIAFLNIAKEAKSSGTYMPSH